MKVLLYCTKGKPYLYHIGVERWWYNEGCYEPFDYREGFEIFDELKKENRYKYGDKDVQIGDLLNAKIVCECEIDKVEEIRMLQDNNMTYETKTLTEEQLLIKSCLEGYQLGNYLGYLSENEYGYALHLSNLKIFDEPKELSDYSIFEPEHYIFRDIKKAPQNMCRVVKEPEEMWFAPKEQYILISIQPQHLVNILNGKKTIEIRKQILNVMKEKLC